MSCESDVSTSGLGVKIRNISFIKLVEHILIHIVPADLIKQVNKNLVTLPENMFQFNRHIVGTAEGPASEEKIRIIIIAEYLLVFILHNRSKLLKIADHQQLYSAKRQVAVLVPPKGGIDGVEGIGPDHTDLIDDEQVEAFDNVDLFAAHLISGRIITVVPDI